MSKPELKVKPIENGTVIDHITANKALQVLKIKDRRQGAWIQRTW